MPINMPAPHPTKGLQCGKCKWFYVGYRGKTCQLSREVKTDTPACVEFLPFKTNSFSLVEGDKYIREIEATAKVFSESFIAQIQKELDDYHLFDVGSLSPTSYLDESGMAGLSHKFEVCQAYLDRVLHIRNTLMEKQIDLQGLMKDVQAYCLAYFTEQVRALKNDTERGAFYRHAVPALNQALDRLEGLVNKADRTYTNLKDTHFNLARCQDSALAIWNSRVQQLDATKRSRI